MKKTRLAALALCMCLLGAIAGTGATVTEPDPEPAAALEIGCILPPTYADAYFGCGKVLSNWGSGANIRIQSKNSDYGLRVTVKSGGSWRQQPIFHPRIYSGVYTVNGHNGQTIEGIRIIRCVIGGSCGGYRTIY